MVWATCMWGIGVLTSFVVLLLLVSLLCCFPLFLCGLDFFRRFCCVITMSSFVLWMLSIVYMGDCVGRMCILCGC